MAFQDWWFWAVAGLGLAFLELFAPRFVFLGAAGGAGVVSCLMAAFPALFDAFMVELAIFLVASFLVWLGLMRMTDNVQDESDF